MDASFYAHMIYHIYVGARSATHVITEFEYMTYYDMMQIIIDVADSSIYNYYSI